MSYRCTTHGCNNEAIFDTNICDVCLESAAKSSAENFGAPEILGCRQCGETFFSTTDFIGHVCDEEAPWFTNLKNLLKQGK